MHLYFLSFSNKKKRWPFTGTIAYKLIAVYFNSPGFAPGNRAGWMRRQ